MLDPELKRLDEQGLMARLKLAEDEAAFEELALRFETRLFRFALRHWRDEAQCHDLVQETLLRVWRHRASYRRGARVSTWIFAILLNLIRDQARRLKPELSMTRPEVLAVAELQAGQKENALEAAEREELSALLLESIAQLNPVQAGMLRDRLMNDSTLEEAGRTQGLKAAAARAQASRAYQKLREILRKRSGKKGQP